MSDRTYDVTDSRTLRTLASFRSLPSARAYLQAMPRAFRFNTVITDHLTGKVVL